ncbi:hypothetical protein FG386_002828 [Cryptosporidium ryanae]|uniref:uncharacterized protein n=1 Tax=Cryptosporidium ryanae TaxID=515981 RepID=UPI00351A73DA|nr:hypothetical protein FG386_002828 [Cryptosporidium ryanae]
MWHQNIVNGTSESVDVVNVSSKAGPIDRKQKNKLRTGPTGNSSVNQKRSGTRFSNNPNVQTGQINASVSSTRSASSTSGINNTTTLASMGKNGMGASSVNGLTGGMLFSNQTSQNSTTQVNNGYKNVKKIPIDRSKFHPSISNLAGAIIGVSGSNQKWMEQESGAQVQILGTNDPEGLYLMVRYNEPRELEIVESIIDEIGRATFEGGGGFISHILPNRKQVPIGLLSENQQGSSGSDNLVQLTSKSGIVKNKINSSNNSVVASNLKMSSVYGNCSIGKGMGIGTTIPPQHPQNGITGGLSGGFLDNIPIEWPKTPPTSTVEFEWLLHLVLHSALIQLGPMANHGIPMIYIPMFYGLFTNFRFEHDATNFFHNFIIQNGLIGLIQALPHIFIEGPQTVVDTRDIPKLSPIFKVDLESGITPLLLPAQPITVSFPNFKIADEAFWKMGVLPPEFPSNPNITPRHFLNIHHSDQIYNLKSHFYLNNANSISVSGVHINQSKAFIGNSATLTQNSVQENNGSQSLSNLKSPLIQSEKTNEVLNSSLIANTSIGSGNKVENKTMNAATASTSGTTINSNISDVANIYNGGSSLENNANSNTTDILKCNESNNATSNFNLNFAEGNNNDRTSISNALTLNQISKYKISKTLFNEIKPLEFSNHNAHGKNDIPHTPLMIVLQGVHFLLRRWITKRLAPHYIPKSTLDFLPLDILESEFSQFYKIPLNIETLGWTNLLHFVEAFPEAWTVENVGPDEFTLIPAPYPDFYMIAKSRGIVSSNDNENNNVNGSNSNKSDDLNDHLKNKINNNEDTSNNGIKSGNLSTISTKTFLSSEIKANFLPESGLEKIRGSVRNNGKINQSNNGNGFTVNNVENIQNIIKQTQDFINEAIISGYPPNSLEIKAINEIINGVNMGVYNLDNNISSSLYELVTKVTNSLPKFSKFTNINSNNKSPVIRPSRFDSVGRSNNMNGFGHAGIDSSSASTSPSSATTSASVLSSSVINNCNNIHIPSKTVNNDSSSNITNNKNIEEANIDSSIINNKQPNSSSKRVFSNIGGINGKNLNGNSNIQKSQGNIKQNSTNSNQIQPLPPSVSTYQHFDKQNSDFFTIQQYHTGMINNSGAFIGQCLPQFSPQITNNSYQGLYQSNQIPIENPEFQQFATGGAPLQQAAAYSHAYSNMPNPTQFGAVDISNISADIGKNSSNNSLLKGSGKSNSHFRSNWDKKNKSN